MISEVASFLDVKALKCFTRVSSRIHRSTKTIVAKRTAAFKAKWKYLVHHSHPRYANLVQHLSLGEEWTMYSEPLKAFSLLFGLRKQPWGIIKSVHIDMSEVHRKDLEEFLKKVTNLRYIAFGGRRCHPVTDGYKTVALRTNTDLGTAVQELKGFQKIVVESFGPATTQFKETLQQLVNLNAGSLKELDLSGYHGQILPIDLPNNIELESLITSASMSTFLWDMPNIHCLRHLECYLTNQVPLWKHIHSLQSLSLTVGYEGWQSDQITKFFPNLVKLELKTTYRQYVWSDTAKPTITKLRNLTEQCYGTNSLANFIAPQLREVVMSPLSSVVSNHLAKHSKQLETIIAKGNVLQESRVNVFKEMFVIHPNLKYVRLEYDTPVCACELFAFVKKIHSFLLTCQAAEKVKIEIFVKSNRKHKDILKVLAESLQYNDVEDYGDGMRLNLMGGDEEKKRNFRVLIKFLDMTAYNRDIFFN